MQYNPKQDMTNIIHPYVFILKENPNIQNNLFDYSLSLMRVGATEILQSPKHFNKRNAIYINQTIN